jgi:hypothetical protein
VETNKQKTRNLFLTVLKARFKSTLTAWLDPVEGPLLSCTLPTSQYTLTWWRGNGTPLGLIYKGTNVIKLITSPKASPPNVITMGVRISMYEFGVAKYKESYIVWLDVVYLICWIFFILRNFSVERTTKRMTQFNICVEGIRDRRKGHGRKREKERREKGEERRVNERKSCKLGPCLTVYQIIIGRKSFFL